MLSRDYNKEGSVFHVHYKLIITTKYVSNMDYVDFSYGHAYLIAVVHILVKTCKSLGSSYSIYNYVTCTGSKSYQTYNAITFTDSRNNLECFNCVLYTYAFIIFMQFCNCNFSVDRFPRYETNDFDLINSTHCSGRCNHQQHALPIECFLFLCTVFYW